MESQTLTLKSIKGALLLLLDRPFKDKNIPEIKDLNVLINFRRLGIGHALLDEVEQVIRTRSKVVGIGVGLLSSYGSAQRIYVKRGYVPDGLGIYKDGKHLQYFDTVTVDDDLVLYLTKTFI